MEMPGKVEPFVRLIANPSKDIDWVRLDMLLQQRAKLYTGQAPGTIEFTFRSNGEMRNVTELQEDALDHLQQPKTSILDNHTR